MVTTPSFFWNRTTQGFLAHSTNISYGARGIYRVYDTEPNRKGDYWFRDFGMVTACAYMTELGFRAIGTIYTAPLATEAMNLHRLSELKNPVTGQTLYPGARNYNELPRVVRERIFGSLIRNSSTLVPKLSRDLELQKLESAEKLPDEVKNTIRTLLNGPVADADSLLQRHLTATGLKIEDIRAISRIENATLRNDAITALHQQKHRGNPEVITHAVKVEDARQMGILLDHLHKNLNFSEYLKDKYLSDHPLSSTVANVLQDYSDKLSTMQTKGKNELPALLQDLLKLPVESREAEFKKRFANIESSLELRKGVLLATEKERRAFRQLGETIKTQLTDPKKSANLSDLQKEVTAFYTRLQTNQKHHLKILWDNHAIPDIQSRITQKIEAAVESVQKLEPGKSRHQVLLEKLDDLGLDTLMAESNPGEALQTLRQNLQETLPDDPSSFIADTKLKAAKKHIQAFADALQKDADGLLGKLMKPMGNTAEEFQRLVVDGIHSKTMSNAVNKIQKNGTWPIMAATVLLNLFFYGYLASNFDNKILQPFQKKLVAERGTSQDIVTAGYMGLLPGLAVMTQMVDKISLPVFKRMGHLSRFAVVGGAALATFAGSTYAFLMQRLQNPPSQQPPLTPPKPINPFYPSHGELSFTANPRPATPMTPPGRNLQPSLFQPTPTHSLNGFTRSQAPSYRPFFY